MTASWAQSQDKIMESIHVLDVKGAKTYRIWTIFLICRSIWISGVTAFRLKEFYCIQKHDISVLLPSHGRNVITLQANERNHKKKILLHTDSCSNTRQVVQGYHTSSLPRTHPLFQSKHFVWTGFLEV